MGHGSKVILFSHLDEQPEVQGPAVLVSTERVSTISPIAEDGSSLVAVDLQQLNLHNVICQAKSGMGKTVVFVLSTLQQIEPVAGQAAALVLCHTRELAYQSFRVVQLLSHVLVLQSRYILCTAFSMTSALTDWSSVQKSFRHFQTIQIYNIFSPLFVDSLASCLNESVVYEV
ncbi:hypothetical protein ES288_A09G106200v1 [Gossypium darwinii]|uniref:ATP-dependent RNA helicase n=2 Tax=Gossypium darwinii TaxID=34276 RepID=A0A5D2F9A2_GOSDA|nr:hypothetical protein ES288_A09G106200v1 [Gossypium darwinii]